MNALTLLCRAALALAPLFLLASTASTASAQACPLQDIYEPFSNSCSSASTNQLPLGFTAQLSVGPFVGDADYWRFTLQPNESVVVDLFFVHGAGNIDMWLWSDDCNTLLTSSRSTSNLEHLVHTNLGTSAQEYVLEVDMGLPLAICNNYNLNASIEVSPCLWPGGDAHESTATCGQGVAPDLPLGVTNLLTVESANGDYWEYTLATGEAIEVRLQCHTPGSAVLGVLVDDTCFSISPVQTILEYENQSGSPETIGLFVARANAAEPCVEYSLQVSSFLDPCVPGPDDAFAPNQDCGAAAMLYDGTYPGLVTFKGTGDDFYAVEVGAGESLEIDVLFEHAAGDIRLYLYDAADVSSCGSEDLYLESADSEDDDEHLSFHNWGGDMTCILQVALRDIPFNASCNDYDLVIDVVRPVVGTPMCAGDGSVAACPCDNESAPGSGEGCEQSTGHGSILSAEGSAELSDDDLWFTVTKARPLQPALLVQGSTSVQVPFKDGLLCMGNPTERVEVLFTDTNGTATTSPGLAATLDVDSFETRYYQMWSRDPGGVSPCGTGSNFSSGLEVLFTR